MSVDARPTGNPSAVPAPRGAGAGPDDTAADQARLTTGRHFSGTNTRMLGEHLADLGLLPAWHQLLADGPTPPDLAQLDDDAAWFSYAQFRRCLETAAEVLGSAERLAEVRDISSLTGGSMPEAAEVQQLLGSPAALYAEVVTSATNLTTIVAAHTEQLAPGDWVIEQHFRPGYPPFRAYCEFSHGMLAIPTRLFGLPPAAVVEEACQCDGAPACRFRVGWDVAGEQAGIVDSLRTRTELLEARVRSLHETVASLVSGDDLETVLDRVVKSASRAIHASGFVLAVEELRAAARRVYADGLDEAAAAAVAEELHRDGSDDREDRLVVEVVSTRRRYGWLAAIDTTGSGFHAQERVILEAYARLAATALDSAAALAEARSEAATARVLLELSTALAEVVTSTEMAAKIARAVSAVVDCDRATITLVQPETGLTRIVATEGYPDDVGWIVGSDIATLPHIDTANGVTIDLFDSCPAPVRELMVRTGTVGAATVPIAAGGQRLGFVTAAVTEGPERLLAPHLPERLTGLAAQAASALANARLLDRIQHQALHDPLTGLPNRSLILDRAEQMLARARRGHGVAAALFVDLDGFKDVNDSLGHDVGDQLLRAVAERLPAAVRECDTIGRLGGDEFVVLLDGALRDAPEAVAGRLLDALRAPYLLPGVSTPLRLTASVGIATGGAGGATELLRDADIALYAAKAAGKNRFALFAAEMQTAISDRLTLENDLRCALEQRQLFLVFQPIVDLAGLQVTGVEALLRWRHPRLGIVPPNDFIPSMEETGLIVEVGRWVLREACRQVSEWRRAGHRIDVSVNVSPRQLESLDLVADVRAVLDEFALEPSALVVEVTETAIMRDRDTVLSCLHALKELGVRVAVDDFGTGYSSLTHLADFPVDALKIDRSFVSSVGSSAQSAVLVRALVQLAKNLGLETFAEGVEDCAQVKYLRQERCDRAQGYLFAKPVEAVEVSRLLAEGLRPAGVD